MRKPPKTLSIAAKKLWKQLAEELTLDAGGWLMLDTLAESWDRRQQAREAIAKGGAVIKDRFQQDKPSPWLAVERDAGLMLQRCFHLLGLDLTQEEE